MLTEVKCDREIDSARDVINSEHVVLVQSKPKKGSGCQGRLVRVSCCTLKDRSGNGCKSEKAVMKDFERLR